MEAKFTEFKQGENWCKGKCEDYSFTAKSFDVGSQFGIKGGRVSKLEIRNAERLTVIHYNRGWDVKPKAKDKKAFNAIMKLLENAPKRF